MTLIRLLINVNPCPTVSAYVAFLIREIRVISVIRGFCLRFVAATGRAMLPVVSFSRLAAATGRAHG